MKEKPNQNDKDKDSKEGSALQVAGPGGEITAGVLTIMILNHSLN